MKFESRNPFLKSKSFEQRSEAVIDYNDAMTLSGTMNKSLIMLLLLVAGSLVTWWMAFAGMNPMFPTIGGAIVGFILVLVSAFRPHLSPYLAPGYAIFEGFFIGGISAIFEVMYPGIVTQAVGATFVTFIVCFLLFKYQIVKVNQQFRAVVLAATLAIFSYYLISWLVSLFTNFTPVHHGNSMMSIGISVFVIIVAALNLFLDFDFIEQGVAQQHPKYMEWFGAMGLMVTLVWLYVEFLRLFSKLASRD